MGTTRPEPQCSCWLTGTRGWTSSSSFGGRTVSEGIGAPVFRPASPAQRAKLPSPLPACRCAQWGWRDGNHTPGTTTFVLVDRNSRVDFVVVVWGPNCERGYRSAGLQTGIARAAGEIRGAVGPGRHLLRAASGRRTELHRHSPHVAAHNGDGAMGTTRPEPQRSWFVLVDRTSRMDFAVLGQVGAIGANRTGISRPAAAMPASSPGGGLETGAPIRVRGGARRGGRRGGGGPR